MKNPTCNCSYCTAPATIIMAAVLLKDNVAIDSMGFGNKTKISNLLSKLMAELFILCDD